MLIEERAKNLADGFDEFPLIVEFHYHLQELNRALLEMKKCVEKKAHPESDIYFEKLPTYVHAKAVEIYVHAFNGMRKRRNKEGQINLGDYEQKVMSLAETIDFGHIPLRRRIDEAQESYSRIHNQLEALADKEEVF